MQINSYCGASRSHGTQSIYRLLNINEQSINIRKHPQYDYSYYQ